MARRPEHATADTRALFESRQMRCTTQRMILYEALRLCRSHPTAEELYRLVKPRTSRLSLATVYNTLEALCRAGLARKLPTNGCCRYDGDTSEHPHVRFRDTGEIRDVPRHLSDALVNDLPARVLKDIEVSLGARIEGLSIQILARREAGGAGLGAAAPRSAEDPGPDNR